jgi:hypothetical protein
MDVCWVYPWSVLIGIWTEPNRTAALLSVPIILLILLSAAGSTHVLGKFSRRRPRFARFVLAGLALLAAIIVVRIEHYPVAAGLDWVQPLLGALAATVGHLSLPVLGFALALYLWWRGVRLGSQTPGFPEVEGAFRWGVGRLAVFGLIMALTSRPSTLQTLEGVTTPSVVGFFFLSLLTLGLGRLESLRTRTRAPSLNTQWLTVLTLIAAGVVLLALLLAQLVSFDLLIVVTRPLFDLLGRAVLLLLYVIFIPLAYVIEWLVYLILSVLRANGNQPPPAAPQPSDFDNLLQRLFSQALPPEVLLALKSLGAALLIGVALVLVARGLARWRPTGADADATNEERDSLWNADRAWAMFKAWLRRLLRRERVASNVVPVEETSSSPAAAGPLKGSVRELYARLLREGASAGAPRGAAITPLEHEPSLAQALDPEEFVDELTAAYLRARYAEAPIPEPETRLLAERLDGVRPKGAAQ